MGEVYRARDTKLHREVAVKVLPEIFALDPERLTRFEREAQVDVSRWHERPDCPSGGCILRCQALSRWSASRTAVDRRSGERYLGPRFREEDIYETDVRWSESNAGVVT